MSLARAGDTRWSSHEKTIVRLLALYPSVIDVLDYIETSTEIGAHRSQANGLQIYMKTFNFVFYLHLMKHILGVTNTLCEALQRKNQDILNVTELVKSTKEELQRYRLEGFDSLLKDVTSFCDKYEIEMVNIEDEYVDPKYRRRKTGITNRHHYMVNSFNTVLDLQIQEFGNRFNEVLLSIVEVSSILILPELRARPCSLVYASFSGGSQAYCMKSLHAVRKILVTQVALVLGMSCMNL
ncbi:hypothetical protein L1987_81844 [Smallanthus sonchifolius]|uniref:Uncharacterized protein n=1 Tax=Smallanthus sonchifolius TaxID=185202 RepID=A0ACB8YSQ1_9ASTR|nr:hypothetical protein L1987_81844 [Smallanthus sonchifolius]